MLKIGPTSLPDSQRPSVIQVQTERIFLPLLQKHDTINNWRIFNCCKPNKEHILIIKYLFILGKYYLIINIWYITH